MEVMLRPCKNVKAATTLVTLVAMVAGWIAPVTQACTEQIDLQPAADCSPGAPCCCGNSSDTRACCCRKNDAPFPQPAATPHGIGRTIKVTPCIDALLGQLIMAAPGKRSNSLPPRSFFTQFQRSPQSLLCVWRI